MFWAEFSRRAQRLRAEISALVGLGRYAKRALLAVSDLAVFGFALWLSMSLRLGELYVAPTSNLAALMAAAPLLGVATFFWMGVYKLVTRHIDNRGWLSIATAVATSSLIWAVLVLLSGVQPAYLEPAATHDAVVRVIPRSVFILYPLLATISVIGLRQAIALTFAATGIEPLGVARSPNKNVLIYGAGRLGVQLAEALHSTGEATPIGFVDPDSNLWGQYVGGLKVFCPERTANLVERRKISEILLAIPQTEPRKREAALRTLRPLNVDLRVLPALEDLAEGRSVVSALRPVNVEDLVWRRPQPANKSLLERDIADKCVMVTGAGGAIGSEMVRQALRQGPRRLVLFDSNEAKLYDIEQEVEALMRSAQGAASMRTDGTIVPVLGSVGDRHLVDAALFANGVDTVYHAAAYKCVGLVERNLGAGVANNILGTAVLAQAAEAAGIKRFTLVSNFAAAEADDIVATISRLAEMAVQARAAREAIGTTFSVVRIGAILDGPGSILQRIQSEIELGGPVRVSYPEVTRYLLSRAEAVNLIIQAGAMAKGGEVFAIHMGEPVEMKDLVRSIVRLKGLLVRDGEHPDGDIAIDCVGFGQDERICETPLPQDLNTPSAHPSIFISATPASAPEAIEQVLELMREALKIGDEHAVRTLLTKAIRAVAAQR